MGRLSVGRPFLKVAGDVSVLIASETDIDKPFATDRDQKPSIRFLDTERYGPI